jgi:hypothetical protein
MAPYIHGILVLTDNPVGAGFDSNPVDHTAELSAKPAPTHPATIASSVRYVERGDELSSGAILTAP